MKVHILGPSLAIGVAMAICNAAIADPPRANSVNPAAPAQVANNATSAGHSLLRSSVLSKMTVKNAAGEKIGAIDDLVIDFNTGKISYAALGFGGVLGVGEKLFAVPWSQLRLHSDKNEQHFVLNVTPEALKSAPGFDKDHWPDFADPNFTRTIDEHYRGADAR